MSDTDQLLIRLMESAENDETVWIGDVREAFASIPEPMELSLKTKLSSGSERELILPLPRWNDDAQREFLAEYLTASAYNFLSAVGGSDWKFVFDENCGQLRVLTEAVEAELRSPAKGCCRIVRETERITRLTADLLPAVSRGGQDTASVLRSAVDRAMTGVRAGIDIGGTDIKLALAVDGRLIETMEYDWNPGDFSTAGEMIAPVLELAKELLNRSGAERFDAIGLSFPDVVIADRICGGETPKTQGIRENLSVDYEAEFSELSELGIRLSELCAPGAPVRVANDGNVAAFTAAAELACSDHCMDVSKGVLSHPIGTSLGTGWVTEDGEIPAIPLEFYDSVIDLGSRKKRRYAPADLRSTRGSSGLQGTDRYLGQASAFRYAYEIDPELMKDFVKDLPSEQGEQVISVPAELRKPCLEHLMREAENGVPAAREIFRRIGEGLGQINRELILFLAPKTEVRFIYGRFAKYAGVFSLLRQGFETVLPGITLLQADDSLAYSPLMRELAEKKGVTVAQFGQAVGAIYLSGR